VREGYTIQEYWEMHARLTAQIMDERAMAVAKALELAEKHTEMARKMTWAYMTGVAGGISALASMIALLMMN